MNTPSPLVPQGTQPQRGKSSLYFKVLMILTVHVVLIGGMLLQGCKDTSKDQAKDTSLSQAGGDTTSPTNTTDTTIPPVSTMAMSNQAVATLPPSQPVPAEAAPAPATASAPMAASSAPAPAAAGTGDGKDYVIAKGDTLGAIARRNSISFRALMDANPGVNPRKLKIGQKLQIPASTGAMAANNSGAAAAPVDAAPDSATYIVKSGDTLGKIARAHRTSYKKIMALNDLKTTAIRVGQKLKMPAPKSAGAETTAAISTAPTPGPVSSIATTAGGVAN